MIPKKTEDVFLWLRRTVNTGDVFKSEESRKKVFEYDERSRKPGRKTLQAFDNGEQNTQQDTYDKGYIECLPCGCVGFENNDVQLTLQSLVVQKTIEPRITFQCVNMLM